MDSENLFNIFADICESHHDKAALINDDGSSYSYSELRDLAARFAFILKRRGIGKGERIVVQVEKSPAAVALYLACLQSGIIFVPLNTAYTKTEIDYFLSDARPAIFIHAPAIQSDWANTAVLDVTSDGGIWAEALSANQYFDIAPCEASDVAAICYTSGTTGRSKGAMITHDNLRSNAETLIKLWRFSPNDILLHILPIFHVHGLFVALHCGLFSGATILFESKFDVGRVMSLLPSATVMMGVPTHYTRLLAQTSFGMDCATNMRLFLSGSAPLLAETHREFTERTGHQILERYGMTEAGMITSNPYDGERVPGTVGFPLPAVSARVVADNGSNCESGEIGTLEIKGPNVFAGYWEMPDKTAETFSSDGWMITGDLVTSDPSGRITIVGRAKDLIISGGYNIYPKEIEGVIDDIPGVKESAVIGIPHPDFGETVVAIIVQEASGTLDTAEISDEIADKLAPFKHPRVIHFVDELPRNAMGKVQKNELRSRYS